MYPDALPANPPPRFFKEVANLRDVQRAQPPPGTHGNMHARSTMLHGEVWCPGTCDKMPARSTLSHGGVWWGAEPPPGT